MTRSLIFLFVLQIFSADCFGQENTNENPPNIVLILIDDSGLMDFGSFGGEAQNVKPSDLAGWDSPIMPKGEKHKPKKTVKRRK